MHVSSVQSWLVTSKMSQGRKCEESRGGRTEWKLGQGHERQQIRTDMPLEREIFQN